MNTRLPVSLGNDLRLAIGGVSTRITPSAGLRLAEKLIKVSAREMVRETTDEAVRRCATPSLRKPVVR